MTKKQWVPVGISGVVMVAFGIAFTIFFGQAGAQEEPCVKTLSSPHFDLLVAVDQPIYGGWAARDSQEHSVYETKIEVSGSDSHLTAYIENESTYTEEIYVNGEGYWRTSARQGEGEWEASKAVTGRTTDLITGLGKPSESNILCPDLSNAVKVGEDTVDGASTTHYQRAYSVDLAKQVPGWGEPSPHIIHHTYDYWIDATGQLVKVKHVHTYPPDEGQTERRVYEEVTQILGIGEVNVITAPNVGQ